jgi:hypothetical protein
MEEPSNNVGMADLGAGHRSGQGLVRRPMEDPEDDFFFGRKTPQSYNWGDIEAIRTELPTLYRNG